MICTCFGKTLDLAGIGRTARLILGAPDYDAYLAHHAASHADLAPMAREVFFRERLQAKYGGVGFKCC